ncbi:ankyrin repeat-containing domain protein [Schizothecium vesticola]|uniref:Ankyrin repeat-containing domain protein n=1 Tax=Schizothecium vesticola TaxID=314040 RepID=A0AA40F271_9PEZI|nr:ankyrin repeat-containing domain protein [Schizothecium vesticola]
MEQRRHFLPRFRPGRSLRNTPSAQPEDVSDTPFIHAPPDVESLPPYSPPTYTSPPTEPPPAYQLSSSSATLPHYSAPTERPPVPESHPTPDAAASQPLPKRTFTRAEQCRQLKDIFSRHPWRRTWGHQPTSFAAVLNAAALYGQEQIINELFALGVQLQGNRDCALPTTTPMHEALRGPKPWLAIYLLDRHYLRGGQADELLESKDANGCTPLHIAAQAGETAIARSFIEVHGAVVDPVDDIGRTPLHMAARHGRTETIDMLLEYGADPGLVTQRLWSFDKLRLRGVQAAQRAELLGSWAFISKTLRGALERRNQGHEVEFSAAGADSYQLGGAGQENTDPGIISTKNLVASSSGSSQPRSFDNPMASPSAQGLSWSPEALVVDLHRASVGSSGQEAETAAHREHRARVRATHSRGALSSPEYIRWKEGLDVLFQESRMQKEKNRREAENALDLPRD